jgi:hypothetical protein
LDISNYFLILAIVVRRPGHRVERRRDALDYRASQRWRLEVLAVVAGDHKSKTALEKSTCYQKSG